MTIWAWSPEAYGSPEVEAALREVRRLGANAVTFVPTWTQATARSNDVEWDEGRTATDDALRTGIARSRRLGLEVTVKPHVDIGDGTWRGAIEPTDRRAWFASYRAMVAHYADLARASSADQLVVGTELRSLSGDASEWRSIIGLARAVFPGRLTYAANFDEVGSVPFWPELDAIGVDAYFPLAARPTTDPVVLAAAWTPIVAQLRDLSQRHGRPVLFTEAGYASRSGTTVAPYAWQDEPVLAGGGAEQAAAYEALLQAFSGEPWWSGVHWWAWRETNEPLAGDYTPQGQAAAEVLARAWGGAVG